RRRPTRPPRPATARGPCCRAPARPSDGSGAGDRGRRTAHGISWKNPRGTAPTRGPVARSDLFFGAPGRAPRGARGGAVDAPQLVVAFTGVDPGGTESGQDRVQRAVGVPLVEEVPNGAPGAELLGEVAPRRPGPEDPEDAVDDLATIARRAPGAGR